MAPTGSDIWMDNPQGVNCLERIWREVALRARMSLEGRHGGHSQLAFLLPDFVDQDVNSQLLLHCHCCLPAAMFPAVTGMDSITPKLK